MYNPPIEMSEFLGDNPIITKRSLVFSTSNKTKVAKRIDMDVNLLDNRVYFTVYMAKDVEATYPCFKTALEYFNSI